MIRLYFQLHHNVGILGQLQSIRVKDVLSHVQS